VSGIIHEEIRHAYKTSVGERAWESDNIKLELKGLVTVFNGLNGLSTERRCGL
jgi:hypothetical protein